jgi:4-hydroxybenzoyl-CoA thioesterase/acyl-CoA thioester hydrolase
VRTEIDYRKPAKLADELIIQGHLEKVERARFWCAFEVRRAADQQLLITCRQSLALVQMPQGRPVRLPEDWSSRYAHLIRHQA